MGGIALAGHVEGTREAWAPVEPDRVLVARVRAGDESAARELYDAHVTRVFRLVYRLAGEPDLARDLTQDTFIRAFDRIHQYRGAVPLGAWLRAIALSVTFNALRRRRRIGRHEVTLEDVEVAGDRRPASPDLRLRLASAIGSLPERLRVVFVMHDVEGFTHPEIAATLEIPVGTCRARLSYARARLRELLGESAPAPRAEEP